MTIALVATVALTVADAWSTGAFLGLGLLVAGVLIGAAIGLWRARVVEMTGMARADRAPAQPSSVSRPCSWAGTATSRTRTSPRRSSASTTPRSSRRLHRGVTFTGSIVAYLKLSARMSSKPLMLPGKNGLNIGALDAFVALTVWFVNDPQLWLLIAVTVLAFALGWHLVASIGGG